MDNVWCEFFVEHDFLVGLTRTGRASCTTRSGGAARLIVGTAAGSPAWQAGPTASSPARPARPTASDPAPGGTYSSFDGVCQAAALLRRHGVTFNTLSVVNSVTAKHPAEVYRFLTEELGSHRLQWLPCVEPRNFRTRTTRPAAHGGDAWHGKRGGKARKLGLGGDRLVGQRG